MKYAAIDIGTNAARLLIGEISKTNGHEIVKKILYTRIPLQLGYEVFETGRISAKKEKEFIKTIKAFKLISEVFDVEELRACATSAMREAENAAEIKQKIKKETGVSIDIIDGEEEGDLIMSSFELIEFDHKNPYLVIDVGGGSTEISMFKKGRKITSKSFKIGTIRLLKNKVKKSVWEDITKWLDEKVEIGDNVTVFTTGGNINKVHKLFGLKYMQPIYVEKLLDLHTELETMTVSERIEHFNLKEDRAEVIVPALKIYSKILKNINIGSFFVPKVGLSDGIIYHLHKKNSK